MPLLFDTLHSALLSNWKFNLCGQAEIYHSQQLSFVFINTLKEQLPLPTFVSSRTLGLVVILIGTLKVGKS